MQQINSQRRSLQFIGQISCRFINSISAKTQNILNNMSKTRFNGKITHTIALYHSLLDAWESIFHDLNENQAFHQPI
jgi:hypothetical protein